jgi:hypothetical protein
MKFSDNGLGVSRSPVAVSAGWHVVRGRCTRPHASTFAIAAGTQRAETVKQGSVPKGCQSGGSATDASPILHPPTPIKGSVST